MSTLSFKAFCIEYYAAHIGQSSNEVYGLPEIIQKIMLHDHLSENEALRAFYLSATGASFADDETGLYSQSPNYIFGLYLEEQRERALVQQEPQ